MIMEMVVIVTHHFAGDTWIWNGKGELRSTVRFRIAHCLSIVERCLYVDTVASADKYRDKYRVIEMMTIMNQNSESSS